MELSGSLTDSPGDPRPDPEANLGYLFRLAFQSFRAALEEAVADLGLSAQDYGILSVFASRRELTASELARIAHVTRQTMHAAVVRLEAAGLLERRTRNQRVVLLRPTEQGRDRLKVATERVRAVERATLGGLGAGDERAVRAWLAGVATMRSTR
jgi:DNA-binding MarR family transcriptional regulator